MIADPGVGRRCSSDAPTELSGCLGTEWCGGAAPPPTSQSEDKIDHCPVHMLQHRVVYTGVGALLQASWAIHFLL